MTTEKKRVGEMSPEEKRVAIAQACGWEPTIERQYAGQKKVKGWVKNNHLPKGHRDRYFTPAFINFPDYLNDLNACREMRRSLKSKEDQNAYIRYLETTVSGNPEGNYWSWELVDARPEDHCRAFLLTIGHPA